MFGMPTNIYSSSYHYVHFNICRSFNLEGVGVGMLTYWTDHTRPVSLGDGPGEVSLSLLMKTAIVSPHTKSLMRLG